mgnify:CR=1 FL=1
MNKDKYYDWFDQVVFHAERYGYSRSEIDCFRIDIENCYTMNFTPEETVDHIF